MGPKNPMMGADAVHKAVGGIVGARALRVRLFHVTVVIFLMGSSFVTAAAWDSYQMNGSTKGF